MHSERLAYIEKLNNEQELSVEDVASLIADNRRMVAALWKLRQFFHEDMDGGEDGCGNPIVANDFITDIDAALGEK